MNMNQKSFAIDEMENSIEQDPLPSGDSISRRKRLFYQEFSKLLNPTDERKSFLFMIQGKIRQFRLGHYYHPREILTEAYLRGIHCIERGEEIKNSFVWVRITAFNIIRDLARPRRRTFLSDHASEFANVSNRYIDRDSTYVSDSLQDSANLEQVSDWEILSKVHDIEPPEFNKINNSRVLWVQLFPVVRDWLIDRLPNVLQRRIGIFSQKTIMLRYKGYIASVRVDDKNNTLVGQVESINDLILFEGKDVKTLKQEFEKSVDSYLSLCQKLGKLPDKKYSGKISYRTEEETHKEIAVLAAVHEMSINAWMDKAVKQQIEEEKATRSNRVAALSGSLQ